MSNWRRLVALSLTTLVLSLGLPASAAEVEKLLPSDTEIVVSVHIKQFLDAPLVKKHALEHFKALVKNHAEAIDTLDALGFDPFADLTSLTAAASGVTENDRGILIARGKFNVAKFAAKAQDVAKNMGDIVKISKADDYMIYEVKPPAGELTVFVGLPNDTSFVASPKKELVVEAMARGAGKKSAELRKDLQLLIEKVDANQTAWLVLPGSALAKAAVPGSNDDKTRKSLEKIETVTGALTVSTGVKLEFVVTAKSAENAKELTDEINDGLTQAKGLVTILASSEKNLKPAADILNGLKTTTVGTVITIKAEVAEEAIEKALKGS